MFKFSQVSKLASLLSVVFSAPFVNAQQAEFEPWQKAEITEIWQPVPAVVNTKPQQPPSDAIVLFNGNNLSEWQALKGGEAQWTVKDGTLTVKPGNGDITTKREFCDIQLHVEWQMPQPSADMKGQQRNNSGIFFQQRYEVQVLDSYNNPTYSNGQAGSIYKQTMPLVNASRAPGEWQVYDIIYQAPRFEGEMRSSAGHVTVLHNGVLVQNHTQIQGTTEWIGAPKNLAHGCAPLQLQDHGNLVSFRNMWVREL